MASTAILNMQDLLNPITEEFPTGQNLRFNPSPLSSYQSIKMARTAARDAEKNNLYNEGGNEADEHWRKILTLAPKVIAQESKDLEVATWLTEAMVRLYGFQGLRDSLVLIAGLLEHFWDHLYPMPDEDGIDTRVGPFAGLNGTSNDGVLLAPIRRAPLTEGYTPGPFAYYQYQQALDIERTENDAARELKIQNTGFTLATIEQSVNESSNEFFINLIDDMIIIVERCRYIEQQLDNLCKGSEAPSTRAIVSIVEECQAAVRHIAAHKLLVPEDDILQEEGVDIDRVNTSGEAPTKKTSASNVLSGINNALLSREAAFETLLEIAHFFRKTEPHSPVSYALEKAVKWGKMPLEDLIFELIPDSSSRKHFSELTGVTANSNEGN